MWRLFVAWMSVLYAWGDREGFVAADFGVYKEEILGVKCKFIEGTSLDHWIWATQDKE